MRGGVVRLILPTISITSYCPIMDNGQISQATAPDFIRHLEPQDAAGGLALSTEAGWNQNEADWRLLTRICVGLGVDYGDRGLVGTAMAWPLEGDYAWINMVLVTADCRGQGLARAMMQNLLGELSAQGRTAFLDATKMGEGLYRKLGFKDGPDLVRLARAESLPHTSPAVTGPGGVRLMQATDIPAAAALDREVFGLDRRELWQNFLARCPQASWVLESPEGQLLGMVTARDGRTATQLGPLVAVDRTVAGQLLRQALAEIDGPVIMDVPGSDQIWLQELAGMGFVAKRSFNRMTRGDKILPTDWSRYYAICGPDFA